MAYEMLNHLYGGHLIRPNSTTPTPGRLVLFDQTPYSNPSFSFHFGENIQNDLSKWMKKHMVLYYPKDWISSSSSTLLCSCMQTHVREFLFK